MTQRSQIEWPGGTVLAPACGADAEVELLFADHLPPDPDGRTCGAFFARHAMDVLALDMSRLISAPGSLYPIEETRRYVIDWKGHSKADAMRLAVWMADGWFEWCEEQYRKQRALEALSGDKPPTSRAEQMDNMLERLRQQLQETGLYPVPGDKRSLQQTLLDMLSPGNPGPIVSGGLFSKGILDGGESSGWIPSIAAMPAASSG